ncbi:MAG: hypothetical protein AB1646_22270 [Thermodesulfobacteriota bacterium]
MENPTYRVILAGSLKEGFARETVVSNLAALFKRDEERIRKLLAGKPVVVRAQLDLETAGKYRKLIERAGAVCRVEPETSASEPDVEAAPAAPRRPPEPTRPHKALAVCSRCGYAATTEQDVLLLRGDCPKCGFVTKGISRGVAAPKRATAVGGPGDAFFSLADEYDPFAGGCHATAKKRVLASLHSFGVFLILFSAMTVLMILLVAPARMVFHQLFQVFFQSAFAVAPIAISLSCIAIVVVIIPLFNDGLTLGQRRAGIGLVFSKEAEAGGPYLSLVLRGAGVALLSLVPGQLVVNAANWLGYWGDWWSEALGMWATAGLSWLIAGVVWSFTPSKLGFVDYCSGTAQIESLQDAPGTVVGALVPLAAGGGFFLFAGVVAPLLLRLAGWQ